MHCVKIELDVHTKTCFRGIAPADFFQSSVILIIILDIESILLAPAAHG